MKRPYKLKPRLLLDHARLGDVAANSSHAFVATEQYAQDAALFAVPLDGSEVRTVVDPGACFRLLALDGDSLVAASGSDIVRIETATGAVERLATVPSSPTCLALHGDHIYISLYGAYPLYELGGIVRVSKSGGEPEWLVRGQLVSVFAIDEGALYFVVNNQLCTCDVAKSCVEALQLSADAKDGRTALCPVRNPHSLAFWRSERILWTEFDNHGSLFGWDRSLRQAAPLHRAGYTWNAVIVGSSVYWSQSSQQKTGASILRMPLDPGAAPSEAQVLVQGRAKATRLVTNETSLFWLDSWDGGLYALDFSEMPAAGS